MHVLLTIGLLRFVIGEPNCYYGHRYDLRYKALNIAIAVPRFHVESDVSLFYCALLRQLVVSYLGYGRVLYIDNVDTGKVERFSSFEPIYKSL
jgi:hypothetical protein